MPLDDTNSPGAAADDAANAAEQAAAKPALTIDAVREKFPQYHDMSDEQLATGLHKKFYADMPFDQFAGKIGYQPPKPAQVPDEVRQGQLADQLSQEEPPDNALSRVARSAISGAKEGFGHPLAADNTILSDQAQAKLDEIQRQGGVTGGLAQLGSTVAGDIGKAGGVAMGVGNAGFGAFQVGTEQAGREIGQPGLGRDIAAIPESLMGMPEALRMPHPPGSGEAIAADVAKARQTAAEARAARQPVSPTQADQIPTQIITPEQRAQAEAAEVPPAPGQPPSQTQAAQPPQASQPASPTQANPSGQPASETPSAPPKPTRIRTLAQIQQEEGVGASKAQQIQQEEILANSRPITSEEMQARAAGVKSQPAAERTAPEPQGDLDAQVRAMVDPKSTKDAVFVAPGSPMPKVPNGVISVPRPDGTLLTTNPAKAQAFHQAQAVDEPLMANLLGFPETKSQAVASGDPRVVQAIDGQGNVAAEAATSPQGEAATQQAIAGQAPGATVQAVPIQQAIENRAARSNPASSFVMLSPDQLKVDPDRFQYKASDEKGVTGALQGVTKWEPALANPITAWQAADGDLYVVNGHQRHDLATRAEAAGQQDVQMSARIFREQDGYSPDFMKVLGAFQNIAEGSGSAIDAAKVLRGKDAIPTEMVLPELPPKSEMVKQARSLARLSPDAFGMVENGIVPPAYAAHVGELITDPKQQQAALGVLARAEPANANQARLMVSDVANSGFLNSTQNGLFGDEEFAQSLVPERARVLDGSMQSLRRTRGLYRAAVEGKDELTAAGNQLSTEANVREKTANEKLLDVLQRDATTKGPISDALTDAARNLAAGQPRSTVQAAFLASVRKIVGRGEDTGVQPGPVYGGAGSPEEVGAQLGLNAPRKLPAPAASGPDLFGNSTPERAAHAPEPTIKNDQRQAVMPGMEPSARQAQASRDAEGPKSSQLPPDEGLFARPETVQPELPAATPEPPKSRYATSGGETFRDLLHTIPDRMGGHAAAEQWVREMGEKTGHEHIAVIDNKTGEIIHAGTNDHPSSLSFDPSGDMTEADSLTIHHNHPQSGALSGPDIGMLAWPALRDVFAHGRDGATFMAQLARDLRDLRTAEPGKFGATFARFKTLYADTQERAADVVEAQLKQLYKRGGLTQDALTKANQTIMDLTNHLLHGLGAIDLTTTRELPKDIADAVRSKVIAPDGRSPRTLGPGEGTESVYRGVPERPVSGEPTRPGDGGAGAAAPGKARPAQGRLLEEGPGLAAPKQSTLNIPPTPQFDALRDKQGIRKAIAEIKSWFSPTSLRGAAPQEQLMRAHGAEKAQSYAQSSAALMKVRDAVDQLPTAAQIDFTDRMERGQKQVTPELDQLATALRQQLDTWAGKVQSLGRGYLANAIQDYMGHVWGNYPEWSAGQQTLRTQREMQQGAAAVGQAKSPLLGSKAFLKERTFGTQLEGINAGLIPITYNPVDLQLLKLREMQKFYHGTQLADQMKQSNIATWVPAGMERGAEDAGYARLDDRVFQPRLTGDANPAGFGRLEPGNWYAPEPAARLFNRYMSKGLSGNNVIYDSIRGAGNALNSLQLGLSGFHATFVTLDTMKSQVALGLQQLSRGAVGKGAASIAQGLTPYSLVSTVRAGSKLRAAWLDPANATPEWQALAQRLNEGGGRVSMDQFYRSNASGPLLNNLGDLKNPGSILGRALQTFADEPTAIRKAIVAPVKMVGRVLETINEPLMGQLVPRAKLGVFAKMAQDWQDAHPAATPEERSAAMIKHWDSVDNRLGQLVYDNVFWNKVSKDMAFLTTRSVGWNLGTIRELGGGAVDAGKALADVANGRKPELTNRMAYTIAMPIVTALYGGIMNYLSTGQAPQELLDYFFPRTGQMLPSGKPERRNIPGYEKDLIEYAKAPIGTLTNKVSPLLETGMELYHNQDYYGGIIRDQQRDPRAAAYADYLLNQAIPFSWRGFNRLHAEKGTSATDQALAFWGFQPASKAITQPEVGEAWQRKQDAAQYKRREREPGRIHVFLSRPSVAPPQ